jgi:NADH:ubiquinone oxidoreductase subunit 6 (subunit J)
MFVATIKALYYLLAALALVSALLILYTRHVPYALLAFLGMILTMTGLYTLQGAVLVALIQLMVHAGGILAWLICSLWFKDAVEKPTKRTKRKPFETILFLLGIGILVGWLLQSNSAWGNKDPKDTSASIQDVGLALIGTYGLTFELAGLILLLALLVMLQTLPHTKR